MPNIVSNVRTDATHHIRVTLVQWHNINLIIYGLYVIALTSIAIAGVRLVLGLAVDPGAGKVYISNYDGGRVEVANLDGTERKTFISHVSTSNPMGIALDLTNGYVSYLGCRSLFNMYFYYYGQASFRHSVRQMVTYMVTNA